MRLISINVENFGVYSGEHFEFSSRDAHGGFCLVHGRNESGKTTLLQLVREALFGFRARNPYDFGNYSGDVAAKVRCELRDGRQLRFRRRKGTKDRVAGEFEGTREAIDEEALGRLLAANNELYEHVFAFSLDELSSGEKSLRDAGLTEALFGGGIGGLARFRELRDHVRSEHEELFKSRGRKPRINTLLQSIGETRTRMNDSAVDPREYARVREDFEQAGAEAQSLGETIATLRGEESRFERSVRAFPTWVRRRVLLEEMAAVEAAGPVVAPHLAAMIRENEERLSQVESDITRIEAEFVTVEDETTDDGDSAPVPRVPPEVEERVRALAEELGRIRAMRSDIPKRQDEARDINDRVERRVREVNAEWTIEHLDRFATSAVDRARVRRLIDEESSLREREGVGTTKLQSLELDLAAVRGRLEALQPNPRARGLVELLDQREAYRRNVARMGEIDAELERLGPRVDELRSELGRHVGLDELDVDLPVPLAGVVKEAEERRRTLTEVYERCVRRHRELEEECTRIDEALARLQRADAPPDGERIATTRRDRDEAWRAIRARFFDSDESAASVPPDEYESLVERADTTVDDRIRRAEEAARIEQARAERDRVSNRLTAAHEARLEAAAELEAFETAWKSTWLPCGFEPLTPTAMLEWLDRLAELRDVTKGREALENERTAIHESVESFERLVQRAFREAANTGEGLRLAAEEHERTVAESRERNRLLERLPTVEADRNGVDEQCCELAAERGRWDSARRELMRSLGLPEDWEVSLAESILAEVAELIRERDDARRLETRVAEMLAECERFEAAVRTEAETVDELRPDEDALEALARLQRFCEDARSVRSQREAVERSRRETAARLARLRTDREALAAELSQLVDETGLSSREAVRDACHREECIANLRSEVHQLEREMRIAFESATLETIAETLDSIEPDEVERQLEELRTRLVDVQGEWEATTQRRGALRERLDVLAGDNDAMSAAAELEGLRAELVSAIDRWAPLVLVQRLIDRAVERFERDHQPEILAEVSSLFERMTAGRYVDLQRKLDEAGTLIVERADGELREPSQLSTGAREQLYLAIRLAFALRYSERAEPLPIVMDDVLVNFDEDRARRTLEVLVEVSERVQILFLTCHHHIVDIVREVVPDLQAIELTSSGPVSGLPSRRVDDPEPEKPRRGRRGRSNDVSEDAHPTLFPGS